MDDPEPPAVDQAAEGKQKTSAQRHSKAVLAELQADWGWLVLLIIAVLVFSTALRQSTWAA